MFIDDIHAFSKTIDPPASCELLIGAFTELYNKFKSYETSLSQKSEMFRQKIPEIEKSLSLVSFLKKKNEAQENYETLYNLADMVFAKAEVDCSVGVVNIWLGANVMLEYTYDEAIDLLSSKLTSPKTQSKKI